MYDKLGARKVILTSLLIMGVGTVLLSRTNSIVFLIIFFGFVTSIALSGLSPVLVGLSGAGGSIGQLLLVPFTMYLLILTDWRVTWMILGGMILALALPLAFFVLRSHPNEMGLLPDGEGLPPGNTQKTPALPNRGPLEVEYWPKAFNSAPMWQLAGGFFVCGFTTAIIATHFVPFALDRGFAPSTAAIAFGMLGGLNVISILIIGTLSDKFGRKNLLGIVYAVRGLAYSMLILFHAPWALFAFVGLAGMSWLGSVPLTTALTGDFYGLKHMGILTGLIFMAHQIGAAISTYFGGWVYDKTGTYDLAFLAAVLLLAGASVTSFTIREKRCSVKYQTFQPSTGLYGS